jgi:Fe(3+) dicitrate transport protein
VIDVAGDWQLNRRLRLLAGISNLSDRHYYDRVWQTGLEPAIGRAWYTGIALTL